MHINRWTHRAFLGAAAVTDSREQFAAFLKADNQRWSSAVKISGATAE